MAYKKSEATRENIITTARKLFAEKGYEHTDMKEIAGELGMTHAALYYYFKNKEDIYLELYSKSLDLMEESFREAMTSPVPDIPSRISLLIFSYFNFYNDHPDYYRVFTYGNRSGDKEVEIPENLKEKSVNILHMLEEPVQDGIREGVIRPCNSYKTVIALWTMSDGVLMLHKSSRVALFGDQFMDYYATAVNILLNGLLEEK